MPINRQIRSELAVRKNSDPVFDFMNMYKALPLVYKATLQNVGVNSAKFKVVSPSSVCLEWEAQTTILEDRNTNALKANVVDFDILTGLVELKDFVYAGRDVGNRMIVRVETKEVIPVDVEVGSRVINGGLVDASLTGFGIRIKSLGDPELKIRDKVQLHFSLMEQEISLTGDLINITPTENDYRLAVYCGSDTRIPVSIAHYIIRRREEIRREIYEIYTQTIEKARIENEVYE